MKIFKIKENELFENYGSINFNSKACYMHTRDCGTGKTTVQKLMLPHNQTFEDVVNSAEKYKNLGLKAPEWVLEQVNLLKIKQLEENGQQRLFVSEIDKELKERMASIQPRQRGMRIR